MTETSPSNIRALFEATRHLFSACHIIIHQDDTLTATATETEACKIEQSGTLIYITSTCPAMRDDVWEGLLDKNPEHEQFIVRSDISPWTIQLPASLYLREGSVS